VIDDAGVRVAVDVVDQVLVDRPGIDQSLDRIDGTVVEAVGFGLRVRDARVDPRLPRPLQGLAGRQCEEPVDRVGERSRAAQRIVVAGVDDPGIVGHDRLLERRQPGGPWHAEARSEGGPARCLRHPGEPHQKHGREHLRTPAAHECETLAIAHRRPVSPM
jgi:hypothetical protein